MNPAANEIQAPLDEVTLAQATRPQTQQGLIDEPAAKESL